MPSSKQFLPTDSHLIVQAVPDEGRARQGGVSCDWGGLLWLGRAATSSAKILKESVLKLVLLRGGNGVYFLGVSKSMPTDFVSGIKSDVVALRISVNPGTPRRAPVEIGMRKPWAEEFGPTAK